MTVFCLSVLLVIDILNPSRSICSLSLVNFQCGQQECFYSFSSALMPNVCHSLQTCISFLLYSILDPYTPQPQSVLLSWKSLGHFVHTIVVCYISVQAFSVSILAPSSSWCFLAICFCSFWFYMLPLDNFISLILTVTHMLMTPKSKSVALASFW